MYHHITSTFSYSLRPSNHSSNPLTYGSSRANQFPIPFCRSPSPNSNEFSIEPMQFLRNLCGVAAVTLRQMLLCNVGSSNTSSSMENHVTIIPFSMSPSYRIYIFIFTFQAGYNVTALLVQYCCLHWCSKTLRLPEHQAFNPLVLLQFRNL